MKHLFTSFLSAFILLSATLEIRAQSSDKLFDTLSEEDQKAIEALVLYPDSIRNAIFLASTEPEILIRLDALTDYTREEFEEVLGGFEKEEQEYLWELSRYPDLISELSSPTSKGNVKSITEGYPEETKVAALKMSSKANDAILRMNDLNNQYDEAFVKLLSSYNQDVQEAYWLLLGQPEVLEILSDNIKLTLLVGDNYEKDPEGIKQQSDSLQAVIAKRNAAELEDWRDELEANPEAKEELEKAAKDYAEENGYEEEYYKEPRNRTVVVHHYPYWYGHPRWHPYHSWYPYNYYWDWGFHYDGFGNMVIVSLPSYHFSWWFFGNPFWYHHYSHFAHHCLWHHHHHFHHHSHWGYHGMHVAISHWHRDIGVTNTGWLADERHGVSRIKEMGKMEMDRASYNKSNPQNPLTRDDFLVANRSDYPQLSERKEIERDISTKPKQEQRPDPIYVRPDKTKSKDKSKKTPKTRDAGTKQRDFRAPEYHKNVWERSSRSKTSSTVKRSNSKSNSGTNRKDQGRRK